MSRHSRIREAEFDGAEIPLVCRLRIGRSAQPATRQADSERFPRSVEFADAQIAVELCSRASAVAEAFAIGQEGPLRIDVVSADGQTARRIEIDSAVLTACELSYRQNAPADAVLRWVARSSDGETNPFSAEPAS